MGLNDEVAALTGIDFRRSLHELREWTTAAYRLRAEVAYYEDMRKVVLAEVALETRRDYKCPVSEAEMVARTSTKYRAVMDELHLRRKEYAEAEAERVSREKALDVGRSFLAFERKQLEVANYGN